MNDPRIKFFVRIRSRMLEQNIVPGQIVKGDALGIPREDLVCLASDELSREAILQNGLLLMLPEQDTVVERSDTRTTVSVFVRVALDPCPDETQTPNT